MKKIENLSYKQLDSELTVSEEKELLQLLKNDSKAKLEHDKILAVRGSVSAVRKSSFKPLFKERVMDKLLIAERTEPGITFFDEINFLSKKILIGALTVAVLLIGYNVTTTENLTIGTALGVPEVTLDDSYNSVLYSYYGDTYE
ncbi:MAG: hypothetical protein JEY94_02250 [Melioribacteraceae bacterium]|nr:hypothetical protein [Melioribacteraceae bacterium]